MVAKLLAFVAVLYCFEGVRGDCSWSDDEASLNCCQLPNVRTEFTKPCADELNYVYPPVHSDHYDVCGEECIYQKAGFLDADKHLLGDKLMDHGMKLEQTEWIDAMHHGIESCNAKTHEAGDGKCSAAPASYTHCLVHYLYAHCPTQFWTDSEQCNATKEKLEKCPDLIPPPHPFTIIPK